MSGPSPPATSGTATRRKVRPQDQHLQAGPLPDRQAVRPRAADKEHVTKDYHRRARSEGRGHRRHRHARSLACPDDDRRAMAGKHVYCEKPMTRTIAEAHAVVDTLEEDRRDEVGVQSMADPTWRLAHEYIKAGNIGKVLMGQTSYFRNSDVGQWRYYSMTKDMNPEDDRLGHVPRLQVRRRRRAARADAEGCRSTGLSSPSGAATGRSAAACSPTCSSTRRRT